MKYLKGLFILLFVLTLTVGVLPQDFVYADDIRPDEEIVPEDYNPGPSQNRQTNEAIDKVPSTRKATGTKRTEVKEATPSANKTVKSTSSSSSSSASSSSTSSSNDTSNSNSTVNNEQSAPRESATQSQTSQIGEKSTTPKTGRKVNSIPYVMVVITVLGILEVITVRRLIR